MLPCIGFAQASAGDVKIIRHNDAVWWMAWLGIAMKGAVSCDKLRGDASNLRSGDSRMESNLRRLPQGTSVFRKERKPWGRKHLSTRRKRNQLRSR